MDDIIINKVAQSALFTLNLETYIPKEEIILFDLKEHLFMELILKEKDYREALKNTDWRIYQDKNVGITCSTDAIIPLWAYMLASTHLAPFAKEIVFGDSETVFNTLLLKNLYKINPADFEEKRVVVKGCGDIHIPESAYIEISRILMPVAKSIMYGEPCSTVPIYKKKALSRS
ncbi:MAG: DUF2480 family protein [Ginsengibacter sp.]